MGVYISKMIENIEYIGPGIILVIIFFLKLTVDENFNIENLKRLFIEATIDIMSLALSFTVSFLIASATNIVGDDRKEFALSSFNTGLLNFIIDILLLIVIVFLSKFAIRKYSETEHKRYFLLGLVIGYPVSVTCLAISISLLRSLGGV